MSTEHALEVGRTLIDRVGGRVERALNAYPEQSGEIVLAWIAAAYLQDCKTQGIPAEENCETTYDAISAVACHLSLRNEHPAAAMVH